MAGIPVYTSSPINPNAASKAEGATPSTAAAEYVSYSLAEAQVPAAIPATTTALSSTTNSTPARPGAPAGPAPTATARSTASTVYSPTPTIQPTSTQASDAPPAPQPGAVPTPFQNAQPHTTARRPSIPPPPKANEIPQPASYYAPQYETTATQNPANPSPAPPPLAYHQQQPNIFTPTRAQPPSSTTSTPYDLSHPPGYIQDSRASFDERPIDPYQPFANSSTHKRRLSRPNGGILDDSRSGSSVGKEEKSVWDTAVSWAKSIGEKVVEGEEEVWKRINGEK